MGKKKKKRTRQRKRSKSTPVPIKLSLCMIVRDNEADIEKALASIAPYVDETVIVDTGSTDGTVDICRKFTDKIWIHPWEHDFSLHRNQSLDYATGDWIVYIDSDEVMDPASGPKLKGAIETALGKNPELDAVMLHLLNWTTSGENMGSVNLIRCFKNSPDIRFHNRVHNDLRGFKNVAAANFTIHHYGYGRSSEDKVHKFLRTTSLLKKTIEEDPENPVPYHYMSISMHTLSTLDEAGWWAERSIALQDAGRPCGPQLRGWCFYTAEVSALDVRDWARFWRLVDRALGEFPDHLDSHALATNAAFMQRDWAKCQHHAAEYRRIWEIAKSNPAALELQALNTERQRWKVEFQAANATLEDGGRVMDIMHGLSLAIAHAPNQIEAWREVGAMLSKIQVNEAA